VRRLFVVFVEIALLVLVLRSPFVQYLLADIQGQLSDWMLKIETLPHQQKLAKVRENVLHDIPTLKPYQRHYLDQVTANKQSFEHFYRTYCMKKEINPNFVGSDRVIICTNAKQSELLAQR
jgi:uncharacterized HAD superfamily protein